MNIHLAYLGANHMYMSSIVTATFSLPAQGIKTLSSAFEIMREKLMKEGKKTIRIVILKKDLREIQFLVSYIYGKKK